MEKHLQERPWTNRCQRDGWPSLGHISPNHSFHYLPLLHHPKPQPPCISPFLFFLLDTTPSSPNSLRALQLQGGYSNESSCCYLTGLGTGTAPSAPHRFIGCLMPEPALLLQRHVPAMQAPETNPRGEAKQVVVGAGGNDGEAGDPVHPGHGRADDPGHTADKVARRHQRRGHLHVRPAVGVRLVGGAGRHHGVLHDRRGRGGAVGGRERQVRQREAGGGGGQVRDAHAQRLGQVHALHGEVLTGQRPPVRQEVTDLHSSFSVRVTDA